MAEIPLPLQIAGAVIAALVAVAALIVVSCQFFAWRRKKARDRFKYEVRRELQPFRELPTTDTPSQIMRRVLVREVVKRVARECGGVKRCCPPLSGEELAKYDLDRNYQCGYCVQPVKLNEAGQCPDCPLTVDIWVFLEKNPLPVRGPDTTKPRLIG